MERAEIKFVGAAARKDIIFPCDVKVKIKATLYYESYPWNEEEEGDIIKEILIRTYIQVSRAAELNDLIKETLIDWTEYCHIYLVTFDFEVLEASNAYY